MGQRFTPQSSYADKTESLITLTGLPWADPMHHFIIHQTTSSNLGLLGVENACCGRIETREFDSKGRGMQSAHVTQNSKDCQPRQRDTSPDSKDCRVPRSRLCIEFSSRPDREHVIKRFPNSTRTMPSREAPPLVS